MTTKQEHLKKAQKHILQARYEIALTYALADKGEPFLLGMSKQLAKISDKLEFKHLKKKRVTKKKTTRKKTKKRR